MDFIGNLFLIPFPWLGAGDCRKWEDPRAYCITEHGSIKCCGCSHLGDAEERRDDDHPAEGSLQECRWSLVLQNFPKQNKRISDDGAKQQK